MWGHLRGRHGRVGPGVGQDPLRERLGDGAPLDLVEHLVEEALAAVPGLVLAARARRRTRARAATLDDGVGRADDDVAAASSATRARAMAAACAACVSVNQRAVAVLKTSGSSS